MTGIVVVIEPAELPGAPPLPPYLFSFADQHLHGGGACVVTSYLLAAVCISSRSLKPATMLHTSAITAGTALVC